ncbi:hypothetical protein lerEdw1_016592 [Lerista edwardsae]|nr:hypothetical protein lerEdw1_016592 [Lerista edwardsae]
MLDGTGIVGGHYSFKCSDIPPGVNIISKTWYKNCVPLSTEDLEIDKLTIEHSGNYTCEMVISRAGKTLYQKQTRRLIVVQGPEDIAEPAIIGDDRVLVKTEIGKMEMINCSIFVGSPYNPSTTTIYWLHNENTIKTCNTSSDPSPCEIEAHSYYKDGKEYVLKQLWFKSIKEEDINASYTCVLLHDSVSKLQEFILIKEHNPDIPLPAFTTGIAMVILFFVLVLLVTILCVIFRVDLVLLYRDVTGKDETLGDGKTYDAFVSYLKDSMPICSEEQAFALDILPQTLEEQFGYKLCIFERDISPGGAVVDDVQSFIDRSRRLIIILSKNYVSDKVMFELEMGLHKALVEKKIKVIIIEYTPIPDFTFLPKSLELLSSSQVVKWKRDKSLPLNSRFWKKQKSLTVDLLNTQRLQRCINVLQGQLSHLEALLEMPEVGQKAIVRCLHRSPDVRIKCVNIFIDVQTKDMANCSANGTSEMNVVVEQVASIVCPGKKCFHHLQRSPVKWHKNGIEISHQEYRPGLKLRHDKILLRPAYDKDNGLYVCDYMLIDNNSQWTMRTIVTVNIITKDTVNSPTVLEPNDVRTLEVELGKPLELKCIAQFGFEKIPSSSMQWYKEMGKNRQLVQQQRVHPKGLEGEIFELILKLMEVTEEDLDSHFICMACNSIGTSKGVFKLKRRTEKVMFFLVTLCCVIIILLGLFLGSMVIYQHWIEIMLFCQNYVAKDETVGDSKEFDAFVSYAKTDSPKADPVFCHERQFVSEEILALEHLPQVLENKYGYKLCLTERDILPGGAYTNDIVNALKKSRRAIIILSPRYVNGQATFELEAAINSALEDKTIKLIFIQFEPFQEPQWLPHKVKKALRVLPRIPWKPSTSPTANKHFWKTLRYRMPVKCTKGTKIGWSLFFTPLADKHERSLQENTGLRSGEI